MTELTLPRHPHAGGDLKELTILYADIFYRFTIPSQATIDVIC